MDAFEHNGPGQDGLGQDAFKQVAFEQDAPEPDGLEHNGIVPQCPGLVKHLFYFREKIFD